MSEEVVQITRKYLEISVKLGEEKAFEWLTEEHPNYVDEVLDYLDEFLDVSITYFKM